MHVSCSGKSEEGIRVPEAGVTDTGEPPGGSWELNLASIEEWKTKKN